MPRLQTLLLLLGDILVAFLSFLFSAWWIARSGSFWEIDFDFFLIEENSLLSMSVVVFTIIFCMYFMGMYEQIRVFSRRRVFEDLTLPFGIMFLSQAFLSYTRLSPVMSRWLMLIGSPIAMLAIFCWRIFYSSMLLRFIGRERILFIGNSPQTRELIDLFHQSPEQGHDPIGLILLANDTTALQEELPCPVLTPSDNLLETLNQFRPDRISIVDNIIDKSHVTQALLSLSMRGIRIDSIGDLYEQTYLRVCLPMLTLNNLIFSPAYQPKAWITICQEVYGRLLSLVGLALAWPVMIITAIAVRLDSPGPALLQQTRLGKNGVPFKFLKFRSMYVDADARTGPVRAQENDPRITRVGRFIRLTRIDELPQLINVLRGEMYLVGPRPEMPELQKKLLVDIPLYPQRHRIKPGITGWAQIHHEPEDSSKSTERKLGYDLYYIKNMSPAMDMLIIFHTLKAVALRIGAR